MVTNICFVLLLPFPKGLYWNNTMQWTYFISVVHFLEGPEICKSIGKWIKQHLINWLHALQRLKTWTLTMQIDHALKLNRMYSTLWSSEGGRQNYFLSSSHNEWVVKWFLCGWGPGFMRDVSNKRPSWNQQVSPSVPNLPLVLVTVRTSLIHLNSWNLESVQETLGVGHLIAV